MADKPVSFASLFLFYRHANTPFQCNNRTLNRTSCNCIKTNSLCAFTSLLLCSINISSCQNIECIVRIYLLVRVSKAKIIKEIRTGVVD